MNDKAKKLQLISNSLLNVIKKIYSYKKQFKKKQVLLFEDIGCTTLREIQYEIHFNDCVIMLNKNLLFEFLEQNNFSEIRLFTLVICQLFCQELSQDSDIINADLSLASAEEIRYSLSSYMPHFMYNILGLTDPNTITNISCRMYESKQCNGTISFVQSDNNYNELVTIYNYTNPITINDDNSKYIRKLLESIQYGQTLISTKQDNDWQIVGVASTTNITGFSIEFFGHASWRLNYASHSNSNVKCIFEYYFGQFIIPRVKGLDKDLFTSAVKDMDIRNVDRLQSIATRVADYHQGTSIVFIKKDFRGRLEIMRILRRRMGTNIGDVDLTKLDDGSIKNMTSIDGALIVDSSGHCRCFGVILDGPRVVEGKPSLGARHNSIDNYIQWCRHRKIKAVAVVISEDKYIDVY